VRVSEGAVPSQDFQGDVMSATSKLALVIACLAAGLAHGTAHAGEGDGSEPSSFRTSSVLQFEIRDDVANARANGTWPVREYEPVEVHRAPRVRPARRQYPNVMGVRFADWLAAHEAASEAQETARLETPGQVN
jgi:hypothetical protein